MNSLVNFRGSLAFGQKPLHSLAGKIGTQDVQDVQVQFVFLQVSSSILPVRLHEFQPRERLGRLTAKHFFKTLTSLFFVNIQHAAKKVLESGQVDDTNVFVMGGSHGGFLTAHLIGQYPVSFPILFEEGKGYVILAYQQSVLSFTYSTTFSL